MDRGMLSRSLAEGIVCRFGRAKTGHFEGTRGLRDENCSVWAFEEAVVAEDSATVLLGLVGWEWQRIGVGEGLILGQGSGCGGFYVFAADSAAGFVQD
jgi:hypothetical protein